MLKNCTAVLLNLLLLSEFTVSAVRTKHDTPGIPCKLTYAEKIFKKIFGDFSPESPANTQGKDKFNEAKGKFRAIFPGKNIFTYFYSTWENKICFEKLHCTDGGSTGTLK